METKKHQNVLRNISQIKATYLCVLYIVNLKNDYKRQIVFYKLNSAKHLKKQIQKQQYLSGKEVYVNKILGFYDNKESIHCLNGFKYTLSSLEQNENDYQNKKIDELILRFSM
jgi:hypothetical protein